MTLVPFVSFAKMGIFNLSIDDLNHLYQFLDEVTTLYLSRASRSLYNRYLTQSYALSSVTLTRKINPILSRQIYLKKATFVDVPNILLKLNSPPKSLQFIDCQLDWICPEYAKVFPLVQKVKIRECRVEINDTELRTAFPNADIEYWLGKRWMRHTSVI